MFAKENFSIVATQPMTTGKKGFRRELVYVYKNKKHREEKRIFISLVLFVFNMNKKVGFE